jgi:NAD kinase
MRKNDEMNKASELPTSFLVLNEVVINRGPSPYHCNIDLFLDGKHISSVQGDGKSLHQCELLRKATSLLNGVKSNKLM